MIRTIQYAALLFICLMAGTVSKAQTADDVVKKYLDAIGGETNWKKVNSIKMIGVIKANGAEIQNNTTIAKGIGLRQDWSINGMSGYTIITEKAGWSYNPMQGTKVEALTADQVKIYASQLDVEGVLVDYKTKGHTLEYLGKDDVEGTECYKVKATLKSGVQQTMYFDASSYYMIRNSQKVTVDGKEQEFAINFSNFKKLPDGIVMPMNVGLGMGEIALSAIEVNKPVDDKIFKPNN